MRITIPFVTAVSLVIASPALSDGEDLTSFDNSSRDAVNHVVNQIVCGPEEPEDHHTHYTQSQQVIEDSALLIGCLLREADDGSNNEENIRLAVRGLQENLAAYAANFDMELIDSPDENGDYDGIIGEWTTEDFIDVAMAMNVDTIFRVNAFDPLSVEYADMERFRQELQRFNLSAVEAAQLWAMELEFQEGMNTTPQYRDLPLCDDTIGWGLNDIPCDQRASLEQPATVQVTAITFNI